MPRGGSVIETIDYLKDRYSEEQARFNLFDAKCSQLLAFLTTVLAALGATAVIKSESMFEPSFPIEWIKLVAFLIASFSLVCAWGHSLLALKIGGCPIQPKDRDTANYLDTLDKASRDQHIIDSYVSTIEKLTEVVNEKSRYIELAYEELTMSAWFLGGVTAIAIGMEILK